MLVEYEIGGRQFEHDIETRSIDGLDRTAPDDNPILWTEPNSPERVATRGSGFWALALLAVGLVAAAILKFAA